MKGFIRVRTFPGPWTLVSIRWISALRPGPGGEGTDIMIGDTGVRHHAEETADEVVIKIQESQDP